jgi:hypothetical protein
MNKPVSVKISKSDRLEKRLEAVFYDKDGKKIKTVNFGSGQPTGKGAFPDHKDPKIKDAWIARHEVRGTFNEPTTASSLSRWILWNKPTITGSIKDYKDRFGLK